MHTPAIIMMICRCMMTRLLENLFNLLFISALLQAGSIGLFLTVLYLLFLLPILLLYRSLELDQTLTHENHPNNQEVYDWRHTRRPPPKYHECLQFPPA